MDRADRTVGTEESKDIALAQTRGHVEDEEETRDTRLKRRSNHNLHVIEVPALLLRGRIVALALLPFLALPLLLRPGSLEVLLLLLRRRDAVLVLTLALGWWLPEKFHGSHRRGSV